MLIDFTVANYRSIKEPVTLSAIAQNRKSTPSSKSEEERRVKPDNEIAQPYEVEGWDFNLLPVLALFGANASGKSNVVRTIDILLSYMYFGAGDREEVWRTFMPFLLDDASRDMPTHFELRVAIGQMVFTYTLHLDRTRILSEQLKYAISTTKLERLLYQRTWSEIEQRYEWKNGSYFAGPHQQLEPTLKERDTFISLLTRLDVTILNPFIEWLKRPLGISWGFEPYDEYVAASACYSSPEHLAKVFSLVQLFDTGISAFEIMKAESKSSENAEFRVKVWHKNDKGSYWLPLFEESTGTKRLFGLAHKIVRALETGTLMLVDELGSNIHPHITQTVVRMFQSPKTNPKRAQLIFTSHDNTLQRGQLLRRNQIWFTQKRKDGSTELYSLSDFRPRNDLAVDRAYLDGRYGAVPITPDEDELALVLAGEE